MKTKLPPKRKIVAMPRINTRVKPKHQAFIKAKAKKDNLTEGEVFRLILDFYISRNK